MPQEALTTFTVSDAYYQLICGSSTVIEIRK